MKLTRLLRHEVVLCLFCVFIVLGIGSVNPAFFSLATIFEVIRGAIPYMLMGLGVMPVMLTGEIDISFVAIAATASLVTHNLLIRYLRYQGGLGGYLLIGLPMGAFLGAMVGTVSVFSGVPLFPISLGFWLMLYGFNLFFISPEMRFDLPLGLTGFYGRFLVTVKDPVVGETGLHLAIVYVLVVGVLLALILRYSTFGRGLYISGGNKDVAIRSGYKLGKLLIAAMTLNGGLAAFAGILQCAFKRFFDPILFRGAELSIIAACVVGGVAIGGGRGSVPGVLAGVFFIQLLTRGLVYLGIKPIWHQFVLGSILLGFITFITTRQKLWRIKR